MQKTSKKKYHAKEAYAVYTGGGIWIFHGTVKEGNRFFLTDDYGFTLILDADPSDFDESLYEDWQQEHLIEELTGNSRQSFCKSLIKALLPTDTEHRGGITDEELEFYKGYFKLEY